MDNGHQRPSNAFDLNQKDRPKYFFDDRQNILQSDSIWLRHSNQRVRINEDRESQTESAVYRRVTETETPNVYVSQHCSNCDRFNSDKENRNWTHTEWKNNRVSDTVDNRRWTRCEWCKNLELNRSEIDVMMKNKSCGGDDALSVAMETEIIGSSCNGNSTVGGGSNNSSSTDTGNNRLMTNENVLDHLKGMSLSDRRASVAPRITLTNVEDDDDDDGQACKKGRPYQEEEEAMMTDEDQCTSPLSPRFLAVPKIEELGPERRPPQLVKIM